jgi:DNA helicase-2/ATP-dependent DNA helicase PcrA
MKKIFLKKTDISTEHIPPSKTQYVLRYADELNTAQLDAVMHTTGAALVIAGAGSGKTRTLVYRVARLIEDGIDPRSILLLTFTRKSSAEMLRRSATLLDGRCSMVSGGTFHSFAHGVLRRMSKLIGIQPNFSVIDSADAEDVVSLVRSKVIDVQKAKRFPKKNTLFAMVSSMVNRQISLADVLATEYPNYADDEPLIARIAELYYEYKRRSNLMDYDDLLVSLLRLCKEVPAARHELERMYQHIMIDEYQDTNALQHAIVRHIAGTRENVMVVGDDAQSIYGFRGARFENIMEFPASFQRCRIIKLEENYRSTQPILALTNAVIERATVRHEKELYSRRSGGDFPMLIRTGNERQQSAVVVQQILELREQGIPLEKIAVLFRSGFHAFDLEVELGKANIPFQKFGGFKFIETAHIKDIIAHIRVLVNPNDMVSWNRVLLLLEGVGPRTASSIMDALQTGSMSITHSAEISGITRGNESVTMLFRTLSRLRESTQTAEEIVWQVVEYYRPILKKKYDDYSKRLKDVEAFCALAVRATTLQEFLNEIAIDPPVETVDEITQPDRDDEFLTLSTIHSAKGLEWKVVFLIWATDGRFPGLKAMQTPEKLEEERRLMYVALTRAQDSLSIVYPVNIFDRESGMMLSDVSRFLAGIPDEVVERFTVVEE